MIAGRLGWGTVLGFVVALLLAGGLVAAVLDLFSKDETSASAGRVWSKEHKHWHNTGTATPGPAPPGPAPPGKVWSEEHGHWHDASAGTPGAAPPGAPPPGKVWSEEHGHWHDAE